MYSHFGGLVADGSGWQGVLDTRSYGTVLGDAILGRIPCGSLKIAAKHNISTTKRRWVGGVNECKLHSNEFRT